MQGCPPEDVVCRVLEAIKNGVINLQMVFPEFDLRVALENAFLSMLEANLNGMAEPMKAALANTVFSTPQILGGPESSTIDHAWRQVRLIAALFWPVGLALVGATALSRNALAVGLPDDLGGGVLRWFIVVVVSGTSIYFMDAANRLANALTMAFLAIPIESAQGPEAFVNAIINILILGAVPILASIVPGGALMLLLLGLVMAFVGFAIVLALILQFVARYALIYVLTAIAPLALLGELFPFTKWLSRTWLRGVTLVLLLQPINALLFVLTLLMTSGALTDARGPASLFLRFVVAAGVLSLLLTINYAIIRLVFGAIQEVTAKAASTVAGIATVVVAGAGALMAGAGVAGAAGAAGAGGAAAQASGGALSSVAGRAAQAEALGTGLLQSPSRFLRGVGSGIRTWGRERRSQETREQGAERESMFGQLGGQREARQEQSQFGREVAPLLGQMLSPSHDAGARPRIEQALHRLKQHYGEEAFWPAARRVGEAVGQYRRREKGMGLSTAAHRRGYRLPDRPWEGDPAAMVGAEVESAIRRGGSTVPAVYLGPKGEGAVEDPGYRTAPDIYDFLRGAEIADLIGEGSEAVEAFGTLHHSLSQWGTKLPGEVLQEARTIRSAMLAGEVEDPPRAFVGRVNTILSRPDVASGLDPASLPVPWRRYVHQVAE